jgi:hypothetical protein
MQKSVQMNVTVKGSRDGFDGAGFPAWLPSCYPGALYDLLFSCDTCPLRVLRARLTYLSRRRFEQGAYGALLLLRIAAQAYHNKETSCLWWKQMIGRRLSGSFVKKLFGDCAILAYGFGRAPHGGRIKQSGTTPYPNEYTCNS